jgi:hypothetical protein
MVASPRYFNAGSIPRPLPVGKLEIFGRIEKRERAPEGAGVAGRVLVCRVCPYRAGQRK